MHTSTSRPADSLSLNSYRARRHLHSFPTRRSSDLLLEGAELITGRRKRQRPKPTLDRFPPATERWLGSLPFAPTREDRKSTRLNSSHVESSYAVFCLKKKNRYQPPRFRHRRPEPDE